MQTGSAIPTVKKTVKSIYAFLAIGFALLVLIYTLRAPLLSPRISRLVAGSIESQLGLEVEIGAISGTYFNNLAISDLKTVRPNSAGPLISLALTRVGLRYSLPALLFGRDHFISSLSITIDGAALELYANGDRTESRADDRFNFPVWPLALPHVRISDASVVVRSPGAWTRFEGIGVESSPGKSAATRLDLSIAEWSWNHPFLKNRRTSVAGTAHLSDSGLEIDHLRLANGRVTVSALADLKQSRKFLPFEATVQIGDGSIHLAGTWTPQHLDFQTRIDQLDLARSTTVFELPVTLLGGILDGQADARLDIASPDGSRASLELTVSGGRIGETLIDHANLHARLQDERLTVERLTARAVGSELELSAVQAPVQPLFSNELAAIGSDLSGKFDLQSTNLPALLRAFGISSEATLAVPAHTMRIRGEIGQATLSIHQGTLETAAGDLSVAPLDIGVPTDGKGWQQSAVNGTGRVDIRDLASFGALLGQENIGGTLKAFLSLGGTLGAPAGRAEIVGKQIAWRHVKIESLAAKIQGDTNILSIESADLRSGRDRISGEGSYRHSSGEIENARLDLNIEDIGHYTQGLVAPEWAASGRVQLEARASGPLKALDAEMQADLKMFRIGGIDLTSASLRARSQGRQIYLERAELERPRQRVRLAARIENHWDRGQLAAAVDVCDVQLEDFELALDRPAAIHFTRDGSMTIEGLVLNGPSGEVSADGRLVPKGNSNLRLNISDLTGSAWFEALTGNRGRFKGLNASVEMSGTKDRPQVNVQGEADELIVKGYPDPLEASFDFSYDNGGIHLQRLSLSGPAGPDISMSGDLPVRFDPAPKLLQGPLSASGRFSVPDLAIINAFASAFQFSRGALAGEFSLGGSWQNPSGNLLLQAHNVDVSSDWQPLPPGPYTFDGDLALASNRMTLQSLSLESPDLTITGHGRWTGMPALAAFLRPEGPNRGGELALEGKLVVPDMRWLARSVTAIRRSAGRLEADLKLAGPMLKPEFEANLRIVDGELRPVAGTPSLRDVQLTARMTTGGVELDRLDASLGGSPVEATGAFRWDQNEPRAVDLNVKGTNLLLFRNAQILLRADTDLRLQGPLERLVLSGDMVLTKGLVKRNLNILGALGDTGRSSRRPEIQLFTLPDPPFSKMRFDVRLTSTSPIEIGGNLAQGSVRPDLHLGGTGLVPILTGKIYTDSTRVNLPAGRLIIQSGVVQFLETDPELPILDLNGRSQMLGYDISVQVNGPYHEPEITLSSIPPLPNDDLMLLLLTGQPPKNTLGRSGRQRQNIQVAVYVGRDILGSLFSEDSSEDIEDVLDRFDFQIGRDVTRSGDETIEAQFRVTSGVFLERDQLFITGEKDTYDYYNTGIKLVFRFR
jgi:translocation and assembly module TamB